MRASSSSEHSMLIPLPMIERRGWRQLFGPPREAANRAHRIELSWQNSLGMTILGLIGVLYALACCVTAWIGGKLSGAASGGELWVFGLTMGGSGLVTLVASRAPRAQFRTRARWLVGLLLFGLSLAAGLAYHEGTPSPLTSAAAQVPLLLVLTVSLMAYRPLQIVALATAANLGTLGGAFVAGGLDAGRLVPLSIYSGLLSLGAVLFGSLLYHLRWSIVDRRIELLSQRRYLERRTSELEHDNERLRRQRTHVLDVAQSSQLQSLSSLAAGVAHEVNTPMGSIQANVDLMRRAVGHLRERLQAESCPAIHSDRKVARSLRVLEETLPMIRRATERVSKVVEQLKRFARLDRGRRSPSDLREGLDSALSLLRHRIGERIAVVKDYAPLPQVTVDAERIHQVFMNLLCNAAQSIEEPGRGTITVSTAVEGDDVLVRFGDTGGGIAPEHLGRIFEPGFTTRGVGVGMGLGLALSHRIVEAHGGRIEVESTPGQGTTMTLRLPRVAPAVAPARKDPPRPARPRRAMGTRAMGTSSSDQARARADQRGAWG